MEYIEQKPVEVDKKKKTRKKVITGVTCGLLAAGLAVGAALLISKVFIEYNNIDLYVFTYDDSDPSSDATISAIKESKTLPKKLRLPTRYKKHKITAIADEVFLERKDVEEIIIPDTVKSIGEHCFYGCSNLVKISVPRDLEVIGTDAFANTAWFDAFPEGDIVTFGKFLYTFKGQMSPNSAVLASRDSEKASLYSGNKVYLTDFTHYSEGVFKDQKNLVYAEFPNTMSGVPSSFFEGCSGLEDIVLPSSLNSIGNASFKNCVNLHIEGFNDLEHLSSIGNYALAYTKLSGSVSFNNIIGEVGQGVFEGCTSLTSVTVGDQFRNIPDNFLKGCTSLTTLNLPAKELTADSHISYIGTYALSQTLITDFRLPFNTLTVREGAFQECPNITTVYAYQNLTGTKQYRYDSGEWIQSETAIQGLQSIEKFTFTEAPNFKGFVLVDKDGVSLTSDQEVRLPKTLSYLGNNNEKSDLFKGTSVSELYLGNTKITTLAKSLCEGATNLTKVDFGEYSLLKTINLEVFKDCVLLNNVRIPDSVTSVSTGVFNGCLALTNVTLSRKTTTIADKTFMNCTSLETIRIPYGYKSLGKQVFYGCTALNNVVFEENLVNKSGVFSSIGEECFKGCSSLQNLVIPDACRKYTPSIFADTDALVTVVLATGMDTVSERMFENSKIQSVYLPTNYRIIDSNAFKNSSLKTIYLANPNRIVSFTKSNSFSGVTLEHVYVPTAKVADYKANSNWSIYESIIEGKDFATISFEHGDYGVGSMASVEELEGCKYALPACTFRPTSDAKEFDHWLVNGSVSKNPSDLIDIAGNVTLTAVWKDATAATVSFDANGGTGSMSNITGYVGETITLPNNGFTAPEGCAFGGWMVSGETALWKNGDSITIQSDSTTVRPYWVEDGDSSVIPSGDDDSSTDSEAAAEEEAKKFPVAAIIIISIAGTAIVGVALFYIIRAIVVKKIYG